MKTKLKKMFGLTALGMTLLGTTVPTWAGEVVALGVSISNDKKETYVNGSMVGARYSADNKQYIGCSINAAPWVVCSASDSAGKYFGCVSYDARHIAQVQRMTDSSHITFKVNRTNAACSTIDIYNVSSHLK